MERAIRAIRQRAGETDSLDIVFVLIGYRDPDATKATPALAPNDLFAPLFGVFDSMSAHEAHLARKLVGQTKLEEADPYASRMGDGPIDYAAIVLCKGAIEAEGRITPYEPPMDWTLSGEARHYIENALIAGTGACAAEANGETINAIVEKLGR
jgi:hypothetical protein